MPGCVILRLVKYIFTFLLHGGYERKTALNMSQNNSSDKKFAILIDADNIGSKYIKIILDEISKEGIATYKRIYGDWTSPNLTPWKQVLLEYSVTPMQQYSYTTGKNSTDSAMIIDAMDILYSGKVDGFCIATSDSDFTRLSSRLRESGMKVIGMGEQKTPRPFVSACDRFIYIDNILKASAELQRQKSADSRTNRDQKNDRGQSAQKADRNSKQDNKSVQKAAQKNQPEQKQSVKNTENQISISVSDAIDALVADASSDDETSVTDIDTIIEAISTIVDELTEDDDDGWILLSDVGNVLRKRYPDFDQRNYGFSKMTTFITTLDRFESKKVTEDPQNPKSAVIYIRNKESE